ncbi:MAG: class I SAM-dependent methyltransferase [Nanoarchaeota archaeon]|nr:class I SAM-dependent methyltransferase [Nanoarchaeota archaeon]
MSKINDKYIKSFYEESAKLYNNRFKNNPKGKIMHNLQTKIILNNISSYKKNIKILEVGCGTGRFLNSLNKKGYKNLYGLDFSKSMLGVLKKTNKDIKTIQGDAYNLPFKDNEFDVVFSVHVLMHLENPKKAYDEMLRVSKKLVIFEVNNKFSLSGFGQNFKLIKHILGFKQKTMPKSYYTKSAIKYFKINKKKLKILPSFYLPLIFKTNKLYFKNYLKLNNIFKRLFKGKCASQYFFIIQK